MYNIRVKDIIEEDFINYKKPSMFIATTKCTFKCEKEDCRIHCQNSKIAKQPNIDVSINELITRYAKNNITKAIVFGGLEPFDQIDEMLTFIKEFRKKFSDDIVIYSGYTENELINNLRYKDKSYLDSILESNNINYQTSSIKPTIIIKYGRFMLDNITKYDEILGIELASSNQYAKKYN